MRINKLHKVTKVNNPLHPTDKSQLYDIVMVYCRYCETKLDVHVYHSFGKFEHFQIVNLPTKISKHLSTRKIECTHCDKTFVLEKQPIKSSTEYLLKLDCSNMSGGMESWYEDSIPKHSKEIYA